METYFAEVDNNGIVKRVIVASQEFINSGAVGSPANWIQTHADGSKRKNYAGVGYKYDSARDAFIPPKPFDSWEVDEVTAQWKAPKAKPNDGKHYNWDEETRSWKVKIKNL